MLRWILGGREAQSSVEKSPVLCIGEEQPKNCFTELQVLKGHFDIVRFLTGERLQELRGHSQQITAITTFTCSNGFTSLITASSDRSLSVSSSRAQSHEFMSLLYTLQYSCLLVLERLSLWVSGGEELCVWDKDFQLLCHRQKYSDTGELILWDSTNFQNLAYEHILWEESHPSGQTETRLAAPKPSEMSIQHLTTNGRVSLGKRAVNNISWTWWFSCEPQCFVL
ncbi:hypothetical protein XENOCAPTIV_023022 [Xenoophorus captivus]|uniref:Uncharacterized protein n=1 Tax=Xenoophorus captivus TaxID=1517983 RepID=A0ABV0QW90_9TELE